MRIQTWMFVIVMLASTTASAQRKKKRPDPKAAAKVHMQNAAVASQEGRNEDALKELDAAWALDPQPNLLLARGHLNVELNKCEDAIKLYEEYLATKPVEDLASMATEAIETCKAALAPPPPPPPPPAVVTSEELNADAENPTVGGVKRPEPRLDAQTDAPTKRSWFKDPILIGLGVGGAVALAAGVVLYSSARGKIDDADNAPTYESWRTFVDDARGLRTYAIIGGAAGAVLVGGAVFYYLRAHRGDEQPQVTVIPTDRGGVVGWTGRF